jgi:hypothetical protein
VFVVVENVSEMNLCTIYHYRSAQRKEANQNARMMDQLDKPIGSFYQMTDYLIVNLRDDISDNQVYSKMLPTDDADMKQERQKEFFQTLAAYSSHYQHLKETKNERNSEK